VVVGSFDVRTRRNSSPRRRPATSCRPVGTEDESSRHVTERVLGCRFWTGVPQAAFEDSGDEGGVREDLVVVAAVVERIGG
jgi:hypothetical protein